MAGPLGLWRRNREHVVVCGDDALAYRLVDELATRYGGRVTVIMRSRCRNYGPRIAKLTNVHIVEAERLDDEAFQAARLVDAEALALVHQDDVGNIHAALRAYGIKPDLRVVIRMFNVSLGHRIRQMFADCAVHFDAAMAAPWFVAAALDQVAPSHIRLPGRTLYAARRSDVPPNRLVCTLADTRAATGPRVLPDDSGQAREPHDTDLVLAIASGTTRDPLARGRLRRRITTAVRDALYATVNRKLSIAVLTLVAVILAGTGLFATLGHMNWFRAVYVTLLYASGGGDPQDKYDFVQQALHILVQLAGLALIPVVTARVVDSVVGARLALATGKLREPVTGHAVVVGLGNVGSRVIAQMDDLGMSVVGVDINPDAIGVQLARQRGIPVIVGDATREETLRAANVDHCDVLVAVSTNDVANLEVGLLARGMQRQLRVVMRLFDDDFAVRVQKHFTFDISTSVAKLAAPAFAVSMTERSVVGTVPVGRRALLVAEFPIAPGSDLDGRLVRHAHEPGAARAIALITDPDGETLLPPPPDRQLRPGDQLVVLATRSGIRGMLERTIVASDLQPEL